MSVIKLLWRRFKAIPAFICYFFYDLLFYIVCKENRSFTGWGIHLYTGKFGQGKTSQAVADTYRLCKKYPQITVLTNIKLQNFPKHTKILELHNVDDILDSPINTICLIDEIGTLFNSRDFTSGKKSVPKSLFQHLCQCRKRKLVIFGTVQRFNLLDKQIRDVSADVIACSGFPHYPFTRVMTETRFDINEYEMYMLNPMYNPRIEDIRVTVQTEQYRDLYDTSELVQGLLEQNYLSDSEILANRGEGSVEFTDISRKSKKALRNRKRV